MVNTTLCLFSAEFPHGDSESTFIGRELDVLQHEFDEILIFPLLNERPITSKLPPNARVADFARRESFNLRKTLVSNFFTVLHVLLVEFRNTDKKAFFRQNLREWVNLICYAIHLGEGVQKATANTHGKTLYYSFWMNDWALTLAILKYKKRIGGFFFRVLGFDIYDERRKGNYMPFRVFNFRHMDQVFAVCQTAANYLRNKKIHPEKVTHSYFGTPDYGLTPFDANAPFTIMSVSNLIPLKRIHLIAEALQQVDFPVRWVHQGSGPLEEELKALIGQLPANITVELRPRVPDYMDLVRLMQTTPINLFINVSETEGLPVSLIEATSLGIPVMATDVGGSSEVCTEESGILLPADLTSSVLAEQITAFQSSDKNTPEFRQQVRNFWEANFELEVAYRAFANTIKAL